MNRKIRRALIVPLIAVAAITLGAAPATWPDAFDFKALGAMGRDDMTKAMKDGNTNSVLTTV
jgi:hypothetical protein